MNRLTPEALDALLAEHVQYSERATRCAGCSNYGIFRIWPCDIYLLASEVRELRRTFWQAPTSSGDLEFVAHYEEGTK